MSENGQDARHPDRWGTTPIPARVAERAATRYAVDADSGCHVSTYSVTPQGYAQIGWQEGGERHMVGAHRAAYVHHTGEQIPAGMTVDHRQGEGCTSRQCVRWEHLRLLENYENARRTGGRDWPLGQCGNGHVDPPTVVVNSTGKVRCALCRADEIARSNRKQAVAKAEWQRRNQARKRSAVTDLTG
jgi:hypothetical protein